MTHEFTRTASSLVFKVCLPTLLFLSIQNAAMPSEESVPVIVIAALATLVMFVASWLFAPLVVAEVRDRGVFVQGSFRSNLGIIGLAFAAKAYGDEGLALASMMMAFVTVLYNILSVIDTKYEHHEFFFCHNDKCHFYKKTYLLQYVLR